ncbi:zinc metalloproteinase nas-1-like isoform X2 [Dendronephthya gigantea]|uniref:zinc metalloproteinase nas-1-like isoform X2 n=1 Tax=Dendronephthya gigantea TaxID=151771 RepID=UPI001068F025|nr:zinc metalloproteinase nas-1-like isoform X2 [Dendronephthya gigantea]
MWINDFCSPASILLLSIIQHILWNNCHANILEPQPELVEGDIVLGEAIDALLKQKHNSEYYRVKRDTIADSIKLWPGGLVPYTIEDSIDNAVRKRIRRAFRHISKRSCIKFIPRLKKQKDYVKFISGRGCYSSIGRKGGAQTISLVRDCEYGAIHEVMHTLGFFHEQSRPDRDRHVKILWWNIQKDMERNFRSYSNGVTDTLNQPYDLKSIMHYGNKAFSKNGGDTIISRKYPWLKLGAKKEKLSAGDTKQLNQLYKCNIRSRRRLGYYNTCRNVISGCFHYAVNSDACECNYDFMEHYCRRSCGFC